MHDYKLFIKYGFEITKLSMKEASLVFVLAHACIFKLSIYKVGFFIQTTPTCKKVIFRISFKQTQTLMLILII